MSSFEGPDFLEETAEEFPLHAKKWNFFGICMLCSDASNTATNSRSACLDIRQGGKQARVQSGTTRLNIDPSALLPTESGRCCLLCGRTVLHRVVSTIAVTIATSDAESDQSQAKQHHVIDADLSNKLKFVPNHTIASTW